LEVGTYAMIKYDNGNASKSVFPLTKMKVTPDHFRPIMIQGHGKYNQSIMQNKKGAEVLQGFCLLQNVGEEVLPP
jgi:hypothetical protein